MAAKPIVAIVGRPNVGKSTFFNRLLGERAAIVQDEPGTTRDRLYGEVSWRGRTFTIVDTGGLETSVDSSSDEPDPIRRMVREQAEQAIREADLIVFMIDVKTGPTPSDYEIADLLRRTNKPTILAVNKADSPQREYEAVEFYSLGMGDPIPVSAYHGMGITPLLDRVVELLPPEEEEEEEETGPVVRIAIVGRPNVGKSRLLNAILGQERAIVSDVPGTTRDPVDTEIQWGDQRIVLIDTAGIRRRGKVESGIEQYSVFRTLRAIGRSDVVLLLIDAQEGLTAQDEHIAGYVLEEYKGLVLVVNKWDLVEKDENTANEYVAHLRERMPFVDWAPVRFISAKYSQGIPGLVETALKIARERERRITTAALNRLLRDAVAAHQPPSKPGKWLKFYYVTQADVKPPTFVFFVNDPKQVQFGYKRYLENRIREAYGFEGTPIRMYFRSRQET
ncbi:small GTP-binding protein [Thermobaculum terrenum ATCC BAA-798]|uniref:GTPase Der n=1 Tax=Thermobaculum terrenum (strain ATCC BAA-798 / CCMEE 7001 / YNP1) TaxID=525904 RepID=D1CCZ9_THET1|nr:ribosome biogenesis GTPase Der [Thermobaculum terrenum]ACZ42664.1 small GTP-binding protein [Thermobaculum terrenum ATCC BAA-798]